MKTVFILQAEHFHNPGIIMQVHATRESANASAASCVNDLRDWVDLPQDATAEDWEAKLQEARRKRADDFGMELDEGEEIDLGEDDGDVWILEEPVLGYVEQTAPAPLNLPPVQFNAILAGLRILQRSLPHGDVSLYDIREIIETIAADSGEAISPDGIDDLVETLFSMTKAEAPAPNLNDTMAALIKEMELTCDGIASARESIEERPDDLEWPGIEEGLIDQLRALMRVASVAGIDVAPYEAAITGENAAPSIKHPLPVGTLLQTVKGTAQGDWDSGISLADGKEIERRSRPGETGRILYANHSEGQGWTYGVEFQECLAWVHIDEAEMNDPSQYIILPAEA